MTTANQSHLIASIEHAVLGWPVLPHDGEVAR